MSTKTIQSLLAETLAHTTQAAPLTTEKPCTRQAAKPEGTKLLIADLFGDFRTYGDPILERMREESVKFCIEMSHHSAPARWLVLLGSSGTGKSMLTKKIAAFFSRRLDTLLDERFPDARYTRRGGLKSWGKVIDGMMDRDFSGMRQMKSDWFLALDDIGTEYKGNRDLGHAKLFDILNEREKCWTVINANKTIEEIGEWDVRISSRLVRNGRPLIDCTTTDHGLR